ncbi:hypothetical protein RA210_U140002 [Rubrivivax sp. A210]|uniref:hypothetical protein n=1 Tax=Rubrivivax sp. A210 TaxID=2772301 RepID=UPI00191B33D2|nr:hypothetical protein [Rubrivivax sp. A210]CAD5370967.1 hypothetical protein RA210_U140002 [Rubrivivax sp. A210]
MKPGPRPVVPAHDFVAGPLRPPWPAWLLLLCGLLMALSSGIDMLAARDRLQAAQARVERWQAQAQRQRAGPGRQAKAPGLEGAAPQALSSSAAQRAAAWAVVAGLRHPWGDVLGAVEAVTPAGLRWTALEHETGRAELRLEGQARDAATALAVVDALALQPLVAAATLTRLDLADKAGDKSNGSAGLRFEIALQLQPTSLE